ncbi:MAG: ribosomal RNA small subunit methyltransferase A [Candidatus Glassbacteria bacterium]|nr:ribosomal RNA small subunit methyltransferase A [Candidatus Glassbacteria bacterium]
MSRGGIAGRGRTRTQRMGQNFLASREVSSRIVDSLGDLSGAHVLEIGPGRGAITGLLAERSAGLTAVELDSRLAAAMADYYAASEKVTILNRDILQFDLAGWARSCAPLEPIVVGNIPYSITNDLLHGLIAVRDDLGRVVLMVQEEVARKVTATPGGKPYGMISVLCACHASPEYLFSVKRGNFVPPPKVDSAVIQLDFNSPSRSRPADYSRFDYLVRRLFEDRRKQVQKVLRKGSRFSLSAEDIEQLAVSSGVELSRRPEELSVDDFARLADSLAPFDTPA